MARFTYSMNVSLDGYVDHNKFAPDPVLFQHWIDQVASVTAGIYGRRIYELMQYWDDDQPNWGEAEHAFATAWRAQPKWVVSRTLKEVGPKTTLISDDIEPVIRRLKAELKGEVAISGTILAQTLTDLGLMDEYRLYVHPVVLGSGKPFFAAARPRLRLTGNDRIGSEVIRLTYVPA
ncbi:MAG: dihydrofolate reductase family protein [Asticcacaulis sp.]